ncbi:MAG: CvpA family protein [Planctomycetota bacterium]|jgi:membrane protein required for colicin V production
MHWLDTTLLALLALGAVFGFMTGLLWQIARVASLALGLWGSILFHEQAVGLVREYALRDADSTLVNGAAYAVVFLIVYFLLLLVTRFLQQLLQASGFAWMDRFLGAMLGAVKTAAVLGAGCLLVSRLSNSTTREWMDRCSIAPVMSRGMETTLAMIPDDTRRDFADSLVTLKAKIDER